MFSTVAMQLHIYTNFKLACMKFSLLRMSCFELSMSDFLSSSEKDGSRI